MMQLSKAYRSLKTEPTNQPTNGVIAMNKYNQVSEWITATVNLTTMTHLQAFADGAVRDQGITLKEGDIVRWSLKSSGRMGLAVFCPEQAEQRKAPAKASPVALPEGITPEVLAQALAIVAATKAPAKKAPVKKKASK